MISRSFFFKEANALFLRIGMCVHMRTKTVWPLFVSSSVRGQHRLLKVLDVFQRNWLPASLLFLDKAIRPRHRKGICYVGSLGP